MRDLKSCYKEKEKKDDMKKIMFISSSGGHLSELLQLEKLFSNYQYCIITEKRKSTLNMKLKYENVHYLLFGTKNQIIKYLFILLINCFISLFYFIKYRPHIIVTTGAHTAGPMCCIGKIFRSKIVFIESYANVYSKTITGKIVYKFADVFIVQWEEMLKLYPKAKYIGSLY